MDFLFDFDGTLFDTGEGIVESSKYALNCLGIPFNTHILTCFIGPPLKQAFSEFFGFDEDRAELATKLFREYYNKEGMYQCHPYPGIIKMLTNLRARGDRIIIATSKPTSYAKRIVEYCGCANCFDGIVGSNLDNTRTGKDEIIQYIKREFEISDSKTAYMIGDKSYDIIGAKKCGVQGIGVTYGYGTKKELIEAGARLLCDSVEELEGVLLSLKEELDVN